MDLEKRCLKVLEKGGKRGMHPKPDFRRVEAVAPGVFIEKEEKEEKGK